ncbi:TetR/AcrR family transcriptional regulator C-terminal domain-containing protein [Streptomyces catenulae]|uniref:TetR/AcrR family transcriptional regulator C-terminal domain-containing protein n=1 Tax=Streptomyces catenulae TaxID=66875 RepID=A0ABV2YTZ1_9ACTN|nr:TetR/AcrR family transcriptional regulator C-terminal domain-containing protein [Streptomyces catenulae]
MVSRIDRKKMVDTALRLLNEVGLDRLTVRRIATELNVQAPALYWHVRNKQELLDEMATEMMRRMSTPLLAEPESAAPWQEQLAETCRGMRHGLLGYRDGAKVFSGTRMVGHGYAEPYDVFLRRLVGAGFAFPDAVRAWWTAYNFTVGLVIEEQSVHPDPAHPEFRDPAYDDADRTARLGDRYPYAARAGAELFGDIERNFEAGLRIIIAGIEATTEIRPTAG